MRASLCLFFLGPGLISTSPRRITRRLQSHANTISKIWNNKKIRIQNQDNIYIYMYIYIIYIYNFIYIIYIIYILYICYMYIYIICIYSCSCQDIASLFEEQTSQDFPSCFTPVSSLCHRPYIWKKGISNSFQTENLSKSFLWCKFLV